MQRLDSLIQKLKTWEASVLEAVRETLENHEDAIIALNVEGQLFTEGVNREGVKIASYKPYRPATIAIKKRKGQPTNRVTLRDTEDFHRSFYIVFGADSMEIRADDPKTPHLQAKYGPILGLTDEHVARLAASLILPILAESFKELI